MSLPLYFLYKSVTWCQEMQMESWTFGTGRPPSSTTESRLTTKSASAPCGIHTKPPRLSPVAGTGKSSFGTKVCVSLKDRWRWFFQFTLFFCENLQDWYPVLLCQCLSLPDIQSYVQVRLITNDKNTPGNIFSETILICVINVFLSMFWQTTQ